MKPTLSTIFILITWITFTTAADVKIGGTLDELDDALKLKNLHQLPTGTVKHDGNYYLLVSKKLSWSDAKNWCEQRGGHLATITTEEENLTCRNLIFKSNNNNNFITYFIGATDSHNEGSWKWITGEPFTFKNWAGTEPNNQGGAENFLSMFMLNKKHLGWGDVANQLEYNQGFIIEWEKSSIKPKSPLDDAPPGFPGPMLAMHKVMQEKILAANDDLTPLHPLIKNYGKKIVAAEKQAARAKKASQVLALRRVRDNLIALLEQKSTQRGKTADNPPRSLPGVTTLELIRKGVPIREAKYQKKQWHSKSGLLKSAAENSHIHFPDHIIGPGDFRVTARVKLQYINGKGPLIRIGSTKFGIDGLQTRAWAGGGVFYQPDKNGERIGGKVLPGTWATWVIERKDGNVSIVVDGKSYLTQPIHKHALGLVNFTANKNAVSISDLEVQANFIKLPRPPVILAQSHKPGKTYSISKLILAQKKSRYLISLGEGTQKEYGRKLLWSHRSTDGGETWKTHAVWHNSPLNSQSIQTLAAAASSDSTLHLLYTTGNANHRILHSEKKPNSGSQLKPTDITDQVKEKGWDLSLLNQGLVTRKNKNRAHNDTILIPCVAGTDTKSLYLITSRDGRSWKRSPAVFNKPSGSTVLTEFEDGTLLMATGSPRKTPDTSKIRIRTSKDGGKTWSPERSSTIPCQRFTGTMASTATPSGKQLLVLANARNVQQNGENRALNHHLDIFTSEDLGTTWQFIRRTSFHPSYYPNLTEITPGTLALTYALDSWGQRYQEITFR